MLLKWGLIGAGNIAHDFAIALRTLPDTEHQIAAIASRSKQKAQDFATLHSVPKAFGSYRELVEDAAINVVYVATLKPTHKPVVMMALAHGKHVLCEKVMAVNRSEAEEMIRFAKSKELFLMEGIWSYFVPSWVELAAQIKSGIIGKPRFINVMHARKRYAEKEKYNSKEQTGGMLTSLGEYSLALMDFVFNGEEPEKIVATGSYFSTGVDKSLSVTIITRNGETLTFFLSCEFDHLDNAEIIGDKGKISLGEPHWCPTKITTPEAIMEFELPEPDMPSKCPNCTGFSYEAEHVRQCLKSGFLESNVIPHETTLKLHRWMDTIRKQLGVSYEQDDINR